MNVANSISQLIEKHVPTLKGNGQEVIAAMRADPPDVVKAQSVAHMIKGASGSIGFEKLSQAALHLEKHLKTVIAGDGRATDESFALLAAFEEVVGVLQATDSSLYQA